MIHLDFMAFDALIPDVRQNVSGVLDADIRNMLARAASEFAGRSGVFLEEITLQPDETAYDLISPHDNTLVIGLREVVSDGIRLLPGDYNCPTIGQITFPKPLEAAADIQVVLISTVAATAFPTALLERWRDVIVAGACGRFLLQVGKSWANTQQGVYFLERFEQGIALASADTRNEFSSTRQTTRAFLRSVWS